MKYILKNYCRYTAIILIITLIILLNHLSGLLFNLEQNLINNLKYYFITELTPENYNNPSPLIVRHYRPPLEPPNFLILDAYALNSEIIEMPHYSDLEEYLVEEIIDGDTILLNTGKQVRYIGVDTPELWEYLGSKATSANASLIPGNKVRLEYDNQKIDPFGRTLAYVFSGNTFINGELVEQGYARVATYTPNVKYRQYFTLMENEARKQALPMWDCYTK